MVTLWPSADDLAQGRIALLGMERELGEELWRSRELPQLWRFHLHYWDWAWGLAASPDLDPARRAFRRWYQSWCAASQFGRMDEWAPYVASLRAWSWCGQFNALVRGTSLDAEFVSQLQRHRDFLVWHLERDVGGNHLIKNLKALVGLGVFLGDQRLLARSTTSLLRELDRQLLPDGGHFERSPSYHCQVMTDVRDLHGLLAASGHPAAQKLEPALASMRGWLDAVVDQNRRLPALNDGYPVPADLLNLLLPERRSAKTLTDLPDSGLTIVERGPWRAVFDNGDPCPDELPAHAHADTLALELLVDGRPLVVDTGTSTYAAGPRRDYERSTEAHSTLTIDASDSTEVWGTFRAGRRARIVERLVRATTDSTELTASHDGYRWLSGRPIHRRHVHVSDTAVIVIDKINGSGQRDLRVRFHLAPEAKIHRVDACSLVLQLAPHAVVQVTSDKSIEIEHSDRAMSFGRLASAPSLVLGGQMSLPAEIRTCFFSVAAARTVPPLAGSSKNNGEDYA